MKVVRRHKLPVIYISSGGVMYSIVTIVNKNGVVYLKSPRRVDLESSHLKTIFVTLYDDRC